MALTDEEVAAQNGRVVNRLAKWRSHFAGWQLGTRTREDPESQAVRDHREVTILLRAEVNALTGLLIEKGVFTAREFTEQVSDESEALMRDFEKRWPGARSSDDGMVYDLAKAGEYMRHWRP